jgi:hypothetical protein
MTNEGSKSRRQKAEGRNLLLPCAFCLLPLPFPWHWFLLSAAAPLVHCASRLNLDLWHDEIYTVDYFVSRGPAFIVSDYSAPNNHVLYSLILWPFYLLSDGNFILRLPSFLLTAGTLAMVFAIALRYSGLVAAVLSASLLGLNQMFLIHTIQVRGYALSLFLTAWLTSLALTDEVNWRRLFAVVFVGAALLYVMPTNVLFFAPLALVSMILAIRRRDKVRQLAVQTAAWVSAGLLAVVCYLPIVKKIQTAAESSSRSTWSYLPVIAANFFRPAMYDYTWFAPLILASLVALVWPQGDGAPRRWTLPVAGLSVVAGAFLLTAVLRISPFERNYCPLLVVLALSSGWLLAELVQSIGPRLAPKISPEQAVVISIAVVSLVLWPQLWTYPRRLTEHREQAKPANPWVTDGYYCYYAANYHPSAVVRFLLEQNVEETSYRIHCTHADTFNLAYYFAQASLRFQGENRSTADRGEAVYAVVPEPAPWATLANDCGLSDQEVRTFRLLHEFGFYRLYQSTAAENSRKH